MDEPKVLFSDILYKLVEEFVLTECYIKQLWLDCNDIIVIEKSYENTDIESNYGIHYIKIDLLLKNLINYKSNISTCILGKRKSVYVELDIGTFDKVYFDILELLLECKIVSNDLDVKHKIFNFSNLLIDIDLSNYNNTFVVSNILDSETYLKYLNKNCKKLCLKTTRNVNISLKYIDDLPLIYNNTILLDAKSIDMDIYVNTNSLDDFLSLEFLLKEKKEQFNELRIYIDDALDSLTVKKFVNVLNSLYGYFKYFKIISEFEYYYYKNNFYKLAFFDKLNSFDWAASENIISIEDFVSELS